VSTSAGATLAKKAKTVKASNTAAFMLGSFHVRYGRFFAFLNDLRTAEPANRKQVRAAYLRGPSSFEILPKNPRREEHYEVSESPGHLVSLGGLNDLRQNAPTTSPVSRRSRFTKRTT
jgi:hypothetical protein